MPASGKRAWGATGAGLASDRSFPRPAYTYPILLGDPQRLRYGVAVKRHEHLADQPEDAVAVWRTWPKHDDSRGLVGRIGANIREVEIQGQQDPVLESAASMGRFSSILQRTGSRHAGKATTRSCARSAAYASAALMASGVRLG